MELTLNNGKKIPQIGLGTWEITDPATIESTLRNAIDLGYRHIDTAMCYENEKEIGNVLEKIFSEGIVRREELFITSKLWNSYHQRADLAIKTTLSDLKMDYIDLYLVHWPVAFCTDDDGNTRRNQKGEPELMPFDLRSVWNKMEEFVSQKLVRSIGVSNFGIENLTNLLSFCTIKPAINQFEMHPYLQQRELVGFCKEHEIIVTSYSSLGSSYGPNAEFKLKDDKDLQGIAKRNKISVSQVILSWITMNGIVIVPRSTNRDHLALNICVSKLKEDDVQIIENITIKHRYVNPSTFGNERFK